MTLSDVAAGIEINESTVSRATSNKVIPFPSATFATYQLISTKLKGSEHDYVAAAQVKWTLQHAVEMEDITKHLSDQKLSDLLKEEKGITVSRRTIAKYREELQIPSSSKRKRLIV